MAHALEFARDVMRSYDIGSAVGSMRSDDDLQRSLRDRPVLTRGRFAKEHWRSSHFKAWGIQTVHRLWLAYRIRQLKSIGETKLVVSAHKAMLRIEQNSSI